MEIAEYIHNEIVKHMDKYHILIRDEDIDEMVDEVLKGTYAFQIIYNDIQDEYPYCSFYSFITRDYRKIVFREETEQTSSVYSYDEGIRFQWFEKETLLLDASIIREMKINQIIK
jgi:hypothetical protein